ncbi:MAG: hypothetical protein V1889_02575 [archaeon]
MANENEKMRIIIDEIEENQDAWGYRVLYIQGCVREGYFNNAQRFGRDYILSESVSPLCITNSKTAANNALFFLATEDIRKNLEQNSKFHFF